MPDDSKTLAREPKTISVLGLVRHFAEVHEKMTDRAFAFVLGAGASKTSGIRGAAEMARDWVEQLHCDSGSSLPAQHWASAEALGVEAFDPNDLAAAYSALYARAFDSDPARGYAYLENEMKAAEPSCGYSVLARILEKTQHKVVVTTNFDNLVADALSIFSTTFPLVCGHESLAGFVRARLRRPLVVKVHHDLLFAPKSAPQELRALPTAYADALNELFKHYTPIVIGYGGNDGSLMGYLQTLPDAHLIGGVYWCYWEGGPPPNENIRRFVARQRGCLVPIPGFDELMLLLSQKLQYDVPDKLVLDRAAKRAEQIVKQWQAIDKRLKAPAAPVVVSTGAAAEPTPASKPGGDAIQPTKTSSETLPALRRAVDDVMQRSDGERRWWQWAQLAQNESDPAKKEQIYEQGLKELPNSAPLLNAYAYFLWFERKDADRAEEAYRRALDLDPKHADTLGYYAYFLADARKDTVRAEQLYKRALDIDSKHAHSLGYYASFLANVRKDADRAEELYKRALDEDPSANHLGNYANFLASTRKDADRAEELYKRALEADPKHAGHLGNYANFLKNVRKDADRAEVLYRRALELDPRNAGILGNYANFVADVRKDADRAEELYKRALVADPRHSGHLGNYANFLANIRKNADRAEELYKRALAVDTKSAEHLGNYAYFLTDVRKDADRAEEFYKRALEADPKDAHNVGNYAYFLADVRKDADRAEELYKRAIDIDPKGVNNLVNYAYFLADARKDADRAEEFYKRALEVEPGNASNLGYYANFLKNVRKAADRAEEQYKRALAADPQDAKLLGNYAYFLESVCDDAARAEELYKRAIESDPMHANNFGNLSRLELQRGDLDQGLRLLDSALTLLVGEPRGSLHAECWMYAYCCRSVEQRAGALSELKRLVAAGIRTGDWDFGGVIAVAVEQGHEAGAWLPKLAEVLAGRAELSLLDGWDAWLVC